MAAARPSGRCVVIMMTAEETTSERTDDQAVSVDQIWRWLEAVPDPEVPVLSVLDIGIIRDVCIDDSGIVVAVTPTYSGCPATAAISLDIQNVLRARGLDNVRVETRLSPAWTTAWITDSARDKLRKYGIAPPVEGVCVGAMKTAGPVECPRCGATDTNEISRFGSTPCKAHWRCNECLEPFDYFKSF